MMQNLIQNGSSDDKIPEDVSQFAIGLIGCEDDRGPFIRLRILFSNFVSYLRFGKMLDQYLNCVCDVPPGWWGRTDLSGSSL